MFQIDNSTAVAAIPAPTPAGSAGYFTDGNPATGVSATILPAEFMNMLMMENLNVLAAGGITPAKGQYNQLSLAIAKIVQSGAAGAASETTAGILKLSTNAQVIAGTDDSTAITPLKLAQKLANYIGQATETAFGWLKIATQAIVNAGADDAAAVTAKKLANATQAQAFTAFTTSGAPGVLTLTPVPAISAYAAPLRFRVKFSQNSTGNDTINVSGKGAQNLKQYDSSGVKISAVFSAGQVSDAEYDGADFILLNQLPSTTQATETVTGGGKVATQSQTNAGTDDATIVTPKKLFGSDPWALQPIGVPIGLFTDIALDSVPPTNKSYRYISLSAGDGYNTGVLTGETVTGIGPLLEATAVISLPGSPLNGKTVRLINTERRVLRAGLSGTVQNDQSQGFVFASTDGLPLVSHSSGASVPSTGTNSGREAAFRTPDGTWNTAIVSNDGVNGTPRVGTETRSKNIGVTFFLRIK